jgi:GNAT superfamily N-acetyltransferase
VTDTTVSAVGEGDRERAISTQVSAFIDDPVERWLFPEQEHYLAQFPGFVAAFGGEAFDKGTVWRLGDFWAVALWLLEQMDEAHPSYPHWYLPWLGVEPARQGGGHGGRLLSHCLAIVDADLPAYLETPNPRTIPFYERHGFEVAGVAQAGDCPPVTLMLREVSGQ